LALPTFCYRIPVIVEEVTTITVPGELIDVVITERGIAISPRRDDLLEALAPPMNRGFRELLVRGIPPV
jgi:citrate lyase subunit alpha/citrate CoA-transferase